MKITFAPGLLVLTLAITPTSHAVILLAWDIDANVNTSANTWGSVSNDPNFLPSTISTGTGASVALIPGNRVLINGLDAASSAAALSGDDYLESPFATTAMRAPAQAFKRCNSASRFLRMGTPST